MEKFALFSEKTAPNEDSPKVLDRIALQPVKLYYALSAETDPSFPNSLARRIQERSIENPYHWLCISLKYVQDTLEEMENSKSKKFSLRKFYEERANRKAAYHQTKSNENGIHYKLEQARTEMNIPLIYDFDKKLNIIEKVATRYDAILKEYEFSYPITFKKPFNMEKSFEKLFAANRVQHYLREITPRLIKAFKNGQDPLRTGKSFFKADLCPSLSMVSVDAWLYYFLPLLNSNLENEVTVENARRILKRKASNYKREVERFSDETFYDAMIKSFIAKDDFEEPF